MDSGVANIMIKRKHTKYYKRWIHSNKVNYITAKGMYSTMHDFEATFFMPEFSSNKIIQQHFHVCNNIGESGIGYDMIVGHDLMVQLGLPTNIKHQLLQQDGVTIPMK